MKLGVVNKSTTVNSFVLCTLFRNITHLAVIVQKTNIKLDILKGGGGVEKSRKHQNQSANMYLELSVIEIQNQVNVLPLNVFEGGGC